jgi:PAS domain S-box-containing protein
VSNFDVDYYIFPLKKLTYITLVINEKGEKPMPPTIQETLLDLFDHVRQDPDKLPTMPIEDWQEGSVEWRLLSGFQDMLEQVQQRMLQFKQMEQQLREKEEQYRSIFEATNDGLIIRDMNGFVVEANPAACTMHGYAYEEFLGLHRSDIIDPKDHSMVAEYMKAIQAGHSFLGQAVDLRKDGTPFPVEVRGTTFTYQGKPHTLSVLRESTEGQGTTICIRVPRQGAFQR